MEPILVILLLFGAFTLGVESTDFQAVPPAESISERQPQGREGRAATLSLKTCLSDRHSVIYRDLTVPFTRPQKALPSPPEPGCSDE